jgi:hypothetical protein
MREMILRLANMVLFHLVHHSPEGTAVLDESETLAVIPLLSLQLLLAVQGNEQSVFFFFFSTLSFFFSFTRL